MGNEWLEIVMEYGKKHCCSMKGTKETGILMFYKAKCERYFNNTNIQGSTEIKPLILEKMLPSQNSMRSTRIRIRMLPTKSLVSNFSHL